MIRFARRALLALCLAGAAGSILLAQPAFAQSLAVLNERFNASMQAGNHAEAERIGKQMVSDAAKRYGTRHLNYAIAVNELARAVQRSPSGLRMPYRYSGRRSPFSKGSGTTQPLPSP